MASQASKQAAEWQKNARINMIKQQVLTNHVVSPRIAEVLEQVARERFAPPEYAQVAYSDGALPLGVRTMGVPRQMLEPMVLARMLELASLRPQDKVLHIGTDTGYATALIAKLASRVYGVEVDEILAARANNHLRAENILNAQVSIAPLDKGFPNAAPYSAIIATGVVQTVPTAWEEQVTEGGVIVCGLVSGDATAPMAQVVKGTKTAGIVSYRPYFDMPYRPLPGLSQIEHFVL